MRMRTKEGKALRTMLGRQQAWEVQDVLLEGGRAPHSVNKWHHQWGSLPRTVTKYVGGR